MAEGLKSVEIGVCRVLKTLRCRSGLRDGKPRSFKEYLMSSTALEVAILDVIVNYQ